MPQQTIRPASAPPPLTPRPQSPIAQQPPAAYGTRPQYNYPIPSPPSPGFGQQPSYSTPGAMPQGGVPLPIPRVATAAASTASTPASPPMPTRPYPYQPVPPSPRERRVPGQGRRGLPGIATVLITLIVCLFIGTGIYYALNRTETPSTPNNTSTVDSAPPNIQNVSVLSTTETDATITWITDEPATSQVILRDSSEVSTETEPQMDLVTKHSVTINGLEPNTTYNYTVISQDTNGNEATSEGGLTTLAKANEADETAPTISEVNFSEITESSATITWITDETATSHVEYGETEAYGSKTTENTKLSPSHSVNLTGLDDGTTYNFRIISKDASGNTATSTNQTFETLTSIPVGYEEGNRAPDFTLEDINNNEVKLSDFRGNIVMVNFWATWCGPCMEELPFFQAISDNESAGGFKILAINKEETGNWVHSELSNQGYTFTFTILLDSDGEVNTLYNVDTLPTTFFIDAEGIIKKIQVGSFSSQTEIESILNSFQ